MRRILLLLFILFSSASFAADPFIPGSQFLYMGMGARAYALGGTGVTQLDNVESAYFNPAANALNEQVKLGLSYGALATDNKLANIGLTLPMSRGILTFNALYAETPKSSFDESGTTIGLKGAFSKQITPHFLFGFGLNLLYSKINPSNDTKFGISTDIGFIIMGTGTDSEKKLEKTQAGFGLFDVRFGFSFINLGLGLQVDNYRTFPDMGMKTGISFDFFKNDTLRLTTYNDLTLPFADFALRYNTGLNINFFKLINLRIGATLGNNDIGTLTLGAGIAPSSSGYKIFDLSYAFVPIEFNSGQSEYAHFLTLNIALSGIDKEPPKIELKSKTSHFSPNNDGVKDNATFDIAMEDNRFLKGWLVTIKNSKGAKIKMLSSHAENNQTLSLALFMKKLFAKKSSVQVPKQWIWNGSDSSGKIVPDGKYYYQAEGWDHKNNRGYSERGEIFVKTSAPKAKLKISLTLFSPNNDGNKDYTIIEQNISGKDSSWHGVIKNNKGKVIKQWKWKKDPPSFLKWDGKGIDGKVVDDGNYTYILKGVDKAGNRTTKKIVNIIVTTKTHPVDVRCDKDAFSPNNDNNLDSVIFTPRIEDKKYFESWQLIITDKKNRVVKRFKGKSARPNTINWDGKGDNNQIVEDGMYNYRLTTVYRDGTRPRSFPKKLIVDTKKPIINLRRTPKLFSPDEDGINDQLKLHVNIKDVSPIKSWKIVIKHNKEIFKTFTGVNPKSSRFTIIWDGKGDKGDIVESATTYQASMEATDMMGNKGKSNNVSIEVDILVIKTSRGLKIRISNIEFAYAKWVLKSPNSPILNRVAEVLKRYSGYKIIIEGHSDNHGKINYNLMLSTRRARTVMRYLIRRGIDEDRMLAKGLGMAVPIASNRTARGRAKNRRVEFILVKD